MKTSLKKGQTINETHRRCQQVQCGYYLQGGCKPCDECKSYPFELKNNCNRCNTCEKVPNNTRFDEKSNLKIKQENTEKIKEEKVVNYIG